MTTPRLSPQRVVVTMAGGGTFDFDRSFVDRVEPGPPGEATIVFKAGVALHLLNGPTPDARFDDADRIWQVHVRATREQVVELINAEPAYPGSMRQGPPCGQIDFDVMTEYGRAIGD